MDYSIACPCGRRLSVKAAQAGTSITCECGFEVPVPGLSTLRELAGQDAYETGPVDVIRNMLWRGELPVGKLCAVSGVETQDVIELVVEAERVHPGAEHWPHAWLGLVVSPILLLAMFQKPRPEVGRDTVVETPLLVASAQHSRVRRAGQKALKRWLRSVPIYAELLEAYPRSRVKVKSNAKAPAKPLEGKTLDGSWME
jgi:hypothetical protein